MFGIDYAACITNKLLCLKKVNILPLDQLSAAALLVIEVLY